MISEHLKYKLDSIGSYLGGYSEMTSIYTEEELAFISLYPSDIFAITTWNTEEVVDLKSVGYIPFTNYFIYDKYQKLIIRDKGDGILGQTEQEEELFLDSENGAYYFILFKDLKRWKQVLLILATQVPTSTEKEYFKKLRINSPNYTYTNERINQVILGTSNITIEAPAKILVYSLDARLNTNVSIEFIKTYAPEPVVYYSYNNEFQDIILTPKNSTWYHFVLVDTNNEIISKLQTKSMGGTGESNWVFFNADLYLLIVQVL
jgi:hypothetical protein